MAALFPNEVKATARYFRTLRWFTCRGLSDQRGRGETP
jgi:hypothetical protein